MKALHSTKSVLSRRGFLEVDMLVGLAIFAIAMMPLGLLFAHERQALKIEYYRSVAIELVDGEMEILAAGAAQDIPDGSRIYPVRSRAAAALPQSHFQVTKNGNHLRLEWSADQKGGIRPVIREITLK
jgi:hypothetical protein